MIVVFSQQITKEKLRQNKKKKSKKAWGSKTPAINPAIVKLRRP